MNKSKNVEKFHECPALLNHQGNKKIIKNKTKNLSSFIFHQSEEELLGNKQ